MKSRIYVVKRRWFLQPLRKKYVILCKLDVNVKNRTAASISFNLSKNSLTGKALLISSSSLKILVNQ